MPADFAERLLSARTKRRWSQARLASEAGLERATVLRLEGKKRAPTPDTVFRLEAALDLEPRTLVPDWPEWSPIGLPTYGARLRERRRELDLSLAEVSAAAKVSIATLSRFEREQGAGRLLMVRAERKDGAHAPLRPTKALAKALSFDSVEACKKFCLDI